MTIQGPRADISWVDEIQDWQRFDQMIIEDMFSDERQQSLKALAAKYLPEDPSKVEWTPAPEPKTIGEMSKADRALMKSIYWGYFHGRGGHYQHHMPLTPKDK